MESFYLNCALFVGNIIVFGRKVFKDELIETRFNEACDHVTDAWSFKPSLVNVITRHSLVAVRNKLFVVTNATCEVYYNVADKFSEFKLYEKLTPFRDWIMEETLP